MIPAPFDYLRADSAEAASDLLADLGDGAKLLAGGQSLIPLMKLRFAQPSTLIDLGRIPGLSYVREEGDEIAIGAMTTHHDVAADRTIRERCPILGRAAATIGDPQVRAMGTIGGSIAHADPAADLPVVLLALQASLMITGPGGTRRQVDAAEFFQGVFTTVLEPAEVLAEIRVAAMNHGHSYIKFTHRAMDWATVAVAAVVDTSGRTRLALANMGARPLRAESSERALAGGASIEEAARLASDGTDPPSDDRASAGFRVELAKVLARRALTEALG